MKQTRQMSETIKLGILLALSGGFMDAYSYIQRGSGFCQCPDRKHAAVWCKFIRGKS